TDDAMDVKRKPTRLNCRRSVGVTGALALLCAVSQTAAACPFCASLQPTLIQRREAAAVAVLGEFVERDGKQSVFRLHQFLQGKPHLVDAKLIRGDADGEELRITSDSEHKP